jgi:hypothetical protein
MFNSLPWKMMFYMVLFWLGYRQFTYKKSGDFNSVTWSEGNHSSWFGQFCNFGIWLSQSEILTRDYLPNYILYIILIYIYRDWTQAELGSQFIGALTVGILVGDLMVYCLAQKYQAQKVDGYQQQFFHGSQNGTPFLSHGHCSYHPNIKSDVMKGPQFSQLDMNWMSELITVAHHFNESKIWNSLGFVHFLFMPRA